MSLFDPTQTQDDLTALLLSDERLNDVNVVSYRRLRLQSELDFRTVLTKGRAGRAGAAVMVGVPTASAAHPGVTPPILDWAFPVVSFEEPNINMNPTAGTLLTAEEIAQIVLSAVHHWADTRTGVFVAQNPCVQEEKEFTFPGIIAYRSTFALLGKSTALSRVATPSASVVAGQVTLTCATAGAEVRYTLDETFPGASGSGCAAAVTYAAPFAVSSGVVVRFCAYKTGMVASAAVYATVS